MIDVELFKKEAPTCKSYVELCQKMDIPYHKNIYKRMKALTIKHNIDISHFYSTKIPSPITSIIQQEDYNNALIPTFSQLLGIISAGGTIRQHNNTFRLYFSLPKRYQENIKIISQTLNQIFPNKKLGKNIKSHTKNNPDPWIDLLITDKTLPSIFPFVQKGKRDKWATPFNKRHKQIIKLFPMHFLSGIILYQGGVKYDQNNQLQIIINKINQNTDNMVRDIFINNQIPYTETDNNFSIEKPHHVKNILEHTYGDINLEKIIQISKLALKKYKPLLDDGKEKKAYAKLLGLYLGDGHIIQDKRPGKENIYRFRIFLDNKYPLVQNEAAQCLETLFKNNKVNIVDNSNYNTPSNMSVVMIYSSHLLELFPQHGKGLKHDRKIQLLEWQEKIVDEYPLDFLWGLVASDGTYCLTKQYKNRLYPIYCFSNQSEDIRELFVGCLEKFAIPYRRNGSKDHNGKPKLITIGRPPYVQTLEKYVGNKYHLGSLDSQQLYKDFEKEHEFNKMNYHISYTQEEITEIIKSSQSLNEISKKLNKSIESTICMVTKFSEKLEGNDYDKLVSILSKHENGIFLEKSHKN